MTIAQLRTFEAVVAAGGFGAAARALGVSQPTVSAQIAALERAYDVVLVDRATGVPTPVGRGLYEIARELFEREAEAEAHLSAASGSGIGVVRIGAASPWYVAAVLAEVRRRFPAVEIEVRTANSARVLELVRSGEVDLGVAAEAEGHDLDRIPLTRQDLVAVVRTDHALAEGKTVTLADLAGEALIGREAGSETRAALERAASAAGLRLRSAAIAEGREAVVAAVVAGLGVGVIAEHEMIDDPRLVMLDIRDPAISVTEYLVCRRSARDTPLCRAVFEALA